MMGSQGGSLTTSGAAQKPISMILSGPAAGIVAAAELSRRLDDPRLITFDMGGTSTDVSLLNHGPLLTREAKLDGIPLRTPMLDTITVGAGGGSIAWLDEAGVLRVGPRSQGSTPGPACYGRGGDRPTVTDADLILGRLDPGRFFGGRLKLDLASAEKAVSRLARTLRRGVYAVAEAIVRVADSNMERAIRVVSLERGFDVREFSLVAFGGAGPLHACDVARHLGLRRVVVPPSPGNFCAWGTLLADVLKERSISVLVPCDESSKTVIEKTRARLDRELRSELRREGLTAKNARSETFVELRYRGQSYELSIPWSGTVSKLRRDFHAAHRRRYGYARPENPVDAVNVRHHLVVPVERPAAPRESRRKVEPPVRGRCLIDGRWRAIDHRDRSRIPATFPGPCVLHEPGATTYLPPATRASVDSWGNLIVEIR